MNAPATPKKYPYVSERLKTMEEIAYIGKRIATLRSIMASLESDTEPESMTFSVYVDKKCLLHFGNDITPRARELLKENIIETLDLEESQLLSKRSALRCKIGCNHEDKQQDNQKTRQLSIEPEPQQH